MSALSAVSNLVLHRPFPADYELVKHLTAVIIFMFLPYCQLSGANVTVDIFTEGMSARAKAAMAFVSSLLAVAFAALLLRQMWLGWSSYMQFVETTPVAAAAALDRVPADPRLAGAAPRRGGRHRRRRLADGARAPGLGARAAAPCGRGRRHDRRARPRHPRASSRCSG